MQREEALHERVRRGEALGVCFFRSGAGAPRAAAAATPPYAHPISAAATVSGAGPGTSNATAIPRSPPKTPPPTAEAAGERERRPRRRDEVDHRIVRRCVGCIRREYRIVRRREPVPPVLGGPDARGGSLAFGGRDARDARRPDGGAAGVASRPRRARHRADRAEAAPRGGVRDAVCDALTASPSNTSETADPPALDAAQPPTTRGAVAASDVGTNDGLAAVDADARAAPATTRTTTTSARDATAPR